MSVSNGQVIACVIITWESELKGINGDQSSLGFQFGSGSTLSMPVQQLLEKVNSAFLTHFSANFSLGFRILASFAVFAVKINTKNLTWLSLGIWTLIIFRRKSNWNHLLSATARAEPTGAGNPEGSLRGLRSKSAFVAFPDRRCEWRNFKRSLWIAARFGGVSEHFSISASDGIAGGRNFAVVLFGSSPVPVHKRGPILFSRAFGLLGSNRSGR